MQPTSIITFEMEGLTSEQTHRYREVIETIIKQGVLALRNGKAILSFNHEGFLQEIEINVKAYKRVKPLIDIKA